MPLLPPAHHSTRILLGHAAKVARREAGRLRRSAERLPHYLPTLPGRLASARAEALAWLAAQAAPGRDANAYPPSRRQGREPALEIPPAVPSGLECLRARLAAAPDEASQFAIVGDLAAAALRGSGQSTDDLAWLALPPPDEQLDLSPAIRLAAADALQAYGERWYSSAALRAAIRSYDQLQATVWRHDADPASWLALAVRQAAARQALAVLTRDPRGLENAVVVCRAALQLATAANLPSERRAMLFSLGRLLHELGQQQADALLLEEAAWVFGHLLDVTPREHAPEEWAAVQVSLGNVLLAQGMVQPQLATARGAAKAFRAALEAVAESGPVLRCLARAELMLAQLDRGPKTWRRAQATLQAVMADGSSDAELADMAATLQTLAPASSSAATPRKHSSAPPAAKAAQSGKRGNRFDTTARGKAGRQATSHV